MERVVNIVHDQIVKVQRGAGPVFERIKCRTCKPFNAATPENK